jgi:hypothetical protein
MYSTAKKYEKFGRQRLLKLAHHLQKGKCRETINCAISQLPALFPALWKFGEKSVPILGTKPPALTSWPWEIQPISHAAYFFGIDYLLAEMLFLPNEPRPWAREGEGELSENATRRDVYTSIMNFIKWYDPKVHEALEKQERWTA